MEGKIDIKEDLSKEAIEAIKSMLIVDKHKRPDFGQLLDLDFFQYSPDL